MDAPNEQNRFGDRLGLILVVALTVIVVGFRWKYDNWLSDFDMLSFFLPNFGYLGDRLASFELPLWNPYEASGSPTIGNPSAGWLYLPVMIAFPIFEVITAFKVMLLLQCLAAAVSTYLLCRAIGLLPLTAMVAGATYAGVTVVGGATTNATVYAQTMAMLPLAMLGIERALQARHLRGQLAWGALGGFGASQIFAAWPGQGTLYAGMILGGWWIYRLLFPLDSTPERARVHWKPSLVSGVITGGFAGLLSASLAIPFLIFSEQSTIPGGDYSNVIGGDYVSFTTPFNFIFTLFLEDYVFWRGNMVSAALIILGLFAVLVAIRWSGTLFFAVCSFVFIDIATNNSFTRPILNLVPGFEHIHGHRPLGSVQFAVFTLVMLGAIGLDRIQRAGLPRTQRLLILLPMALFAFVAWQFEQDGSWIGWTQIWIAIIATVLVVISATPALSSIGTSTIRTGSAIALAVLILAYPAAADIGGVLRDPTNGPDWTSSFGKDQIVTDVLERSMAQTDPGTAVEFMQAKADVLQPFRFAPYSGVYDGTAQTSTSALRTESFILGIVTNGRPMRVGLESITGYNPLHLKYYAEYIDAMNGAQQDYHWLDLMTPAVSDSPLLDMLNVRYVLIPLSVEPKPQVAHTGTPVFTDLSVTVYENPNVYARAWIVHDVQPAQDGAELELLNSGQVDGHVTAFVHGDLPSVSMPEANAEPDSVLVTSYQPESIRLSSSSTADGLLVLSEVYADGWNAYVDGEQVDILRTNHALRGVPLPAGEHEVELKYEPRFMTVGLVGTGVAGIAMVGVWIWVGVASVGERRKSRVFEPAGRQ